MNRPLRRPVAVRRSRDISHRLPAPLVLRGDGHLRPHGSETLSRMPCSGGIDPHVRTVTRLPEPAIDGREGEAGRGVSPAPGRVGRKGLGLPRRISFLPPRKASPEGRQHPSEWSRDGWGSRPGSTLPPESCEQETGFHRSALATGLSCSFPFVSHRVPARESRSSARPRPVDPRPHSGAGLHQPVHRPRAIDASVGRWKKGSRPRIFPQLQRRPKLPHRALVRFPTAPLPSSPLNGRVVGPTPSSSRQAPKHSISCMRRSSPAKISIRSFPLRRLAPTSPPGRNRLYRN